MQVFGIDFTSTPRPSKPISCASCSIAGSRLELHALVDIDSFAVFENFLQCDGEWVAAIDFPFSQPRELVEALQWPDNWPELVAEISRHTPAEFEAVIKRFRDVQPTGHKQLLRHVDRLASSCSPMLLAGVPVGKMFYQGAPRLLAAEVNIVPCNPLTSGRLVLEAYPALLARRYLGPRPYKAENARKDTVERQDARAQLLNYMLSDRLNADYGISLEVPAVLAQEMLDQPSADRLDALCCAVQGAWAWRLRGQGFGVPLDADPLEGWIADPCLMDSVVTA